MIPSTKNVTSSMACHMLHIPIGYEKQFNHALQSRLAHSSEIEEACEDLFSILPAVTNGWEFAAFVVVVFVWWMQR